MKAKDQLKLLRKGFKILREDKSNMGIKFKTLEFQEWRMLQKGFPSYAALRREMNRQLESDNVVEE
jgi:hypothetical protein